MLIILLVLSSFLLGLFTLTYIEDKSDILNLILLLMLIISTIVLSILTYVETYQI